MTENVVPKPVAWTASPRPGRKRHRQNDLGRVERKVMELVQQDGEISPRALHAIGVKNPERILCRLSNDGYLVRVHRGVYKLPLPGRVVIEQARQKKRHVVRKDMLAPEALPCRGIKKGSYLSTDKQPILPGDTVLFRKEGKRSRVGVLVEGDAAGHVTLLVGLGVYEKLEGEPGDFVRVAGFFSRRTKSAARARDANTPHEKAPPPDAVFWTSKGEKS